MFDSSVENFSVGTGPRCDVVSKVYVEKGHLANA